MRDDGDLKKQRLCLLFKDVDVLEFGDLLDMIEE